MLAALQSQPAAPPAASGGATACQRSCDDVRNQCIEAAQGEANKCVAAIQSDEQYRGCTCPTYPRGNYACYRLCSTAYEQAKSCSTPDKSRDCRIEGDRFRSRCR